MQEKSRSHRQEAGRKSVRQRNLSYACEQAMTDRKRDANDSRRSHVQNALHYVTGPTAVGKTGLASGLVLKALENGYLCQFICAQDLFDEMYASLADRSSRQLVKRLARLHLLCIDELGYLNLKPEQTNIFFKLMEERYHRHSTIITTNLMYEEWPNFLGNRPMAEALLSRLRHYCHTIQIQGPPLRDPQG
jgi:DNA replication protein DnaC